MKGGNQSSTKHKLLTLKTFIKNGKTSKQFKRQAEEYC